MTHPADSPKTTAQNRRRWPGHAGLRSREGGPGKSGEVRRLDVPLADLPMEEARLKEARLLRNPKALDPDIWVDEKHVL